MTLVYNSRFAVTISRQLSSARSYDNIHGWHMRKWGPGNRHVKAPPPSPLHRSKTSLGAILCLLLVVLHRCSHFASHCRHLVSICSCLPLVFCCVVSLFFLLFCVSFLCFHTSYCADVGSKNCTWPSVFCAHWRWRCDLIHSDTPPHRFCTKYYSIEKY